MLTELRRSDLLPVAFATPLLVTLAVAAAAAWIGAHWLRAGMDRRWYRHGFLAVQSLLGTAALWSALQLAARFLMLGTTWPLWFTAFTAAASIEIVAALSEFERSMVPRSAGRTMLGLRIAMVLLLVTMLAQPVLWWEMSRDVTRYAAVLLDESASMHIADRVLTPSDKLRLASLFDLKAVRDRPALDPVPGHLADIRDRLAGECAGLQAVSENDAGAFVAFLDKQGASLAKILQDAHRALRSDCDVLAHSLEDGGSAQAPDQELENIRTRLTRNVIPLLVEGGGIVGAKGSLAPQERRLSLLRALNVAGDELTQILRILPPVLARRDEAFYRTLQPDDAQAVEEIAGRTRARIARDVLTASRGDSKSLLDRLKSSYSVKLLRFASDAVPADVDEWRRGGEEYAAPVIPTNAPRGEGIQTGEAPARDFQETTDIGAAIDRVAGEAPPDSLAGVLVLSDGRHNGKVSPEAAARRMGALGVPVCTVLIGSSETPKDAAILEVVAPVSVYLGDKVNAQVAARFVALRGRKARVRLLSEGRTVDETTVDVPEDKFTTSVNLGHTPAAIGIHDYEVQIDPLEGEPLTNNNKWPLRVAASDNRMNVLLVEGRPRWEFRYLRNLLYVRDKAVHLQYVLLEPDRLDGAPPPDAVYASVSRKFGDAEATALPKSREEWMRFDAIILGDVAPAALDEATLETLQHCVSERGALLVVIAGARFMPHAYASPLLREMIPIRYAQTGDSFRDGPEPFYRMRLTAEGNAHPIMQQAGTPQENLEIWEGFPPLTWRHAVASVKEGASVLAYAEPLTEEPATAAEPGARRPTADPEALQTKNPLIVTHPYGLGRVVALACDETWRLRYRKGDVHHHKFWGQLLRWGVGDKLRSGTEFVRIGTDRLTYPVTVPVHVEARILDTGFKAVTDAAIYVNVSRDAQSVIRKQLQYRRDSCGIYETTLPPMSEAGVYRVELEGKQVSDLLALEKVSAVDTEFVVAPPGTSRELSELSTDPDTARAIAAASGGKVAGPESASSVLDAFGPGSRKLSEIRELTLWDSWPMLVLMILIVTAEWLLRRKKGLV